MKQSVLPDFDSLIEPLRELEIAAEWFRVAYSMNQEPRDNPHLHRQLAEMKKKLHALETEFARRTAHYNERGSSGIKAQH